MRTRGLLKAELADYPLFLAAYQASAPAAPQPWPVLSFWQFTSGGRVPGITGNCDEDWAFITRERLPLLGKPAATVDWEALALSYRERLERIKELASV